MKKLLILLLILVPHVLISGDMPAYKLYTSEGQEATYEEMVEEAQEADVILFGEYHNNPICHWLQYELANSLQKELGQKLILGAEMFEADNQLIINEYLDENIGIKQKNFEDEVRLWSNYETDYKPLMELAREKKLRFIATNIPRRYASIVAKNCQEGLENITDEAKLYIAPLPFEVDYELNCYKSMEKMFSGRMSHGKMGNVKCFQQAQAIKDATMAHFINLNYKKDATFLHFNGAFHSNNHEGIAWYLKKYNPDLKILVVSAVEKEDVTEFDEMSSGIADFIIYIDSEMTKTH